MEALDATRTDDVRAHRMAILAIAHVRAIVRTDGRGQVLSVDGDEGAARAVAERLDVARAAWERFGVVSGLGRASTQVIELAEGLVLCGACKSGQVAILAGREATVGLLLSKLRRLVDAESEAP